MARYVRIYSYSDKILFIIIVKKCIYFCYCCILIHTVSELIFIFLFLKTMKHLMSIINEYEVKDECL